MRSARNRYSGCPFQIRSSHHIDRFQSKQYQYHHLVHFEHRYRCYQSRSIFLRLFVLILSRCWSHFAGFQQPTLLRLSLDSTTNVRWDSSSSLLIRHGHRHQLFSSDGFLIHGCDHCTSSHIFCHCGHRHRSDSTCLDYRMGSHRPNLECNEWFTIVCEWHSGQLGGSIDISR